MDTTAIKTRNRSKINSQQNQAEFEAMMSTLGTLGAVPALIGLWSAACFMGGLIASGGPWAMATGLFNALTGI
ncbi:MAG: hypothetical protein V1706_00545 [Pseudomonadota bacterium]